MGGRRELWRRMLGCSWSVSSITGDGGLGARWTGEVMSTAQRKKNPLKICDYKTNNLPELKIRTHGLTGPALNSQNM